MDLPGYEITARLLTLPAWALVRGRRRSDDRRVLLRGSVDPEVASSLPLERELDLMRSLPTAPVPRPLEVVRGAFGAWLVLEDEGLEPLVEVARARPRLPLLFACGRAIAQVLSTLHRRGLALGTLQPAAVLVGADDGAPQIIDVSGVWGVPVDRPLPRGNPVTPYMPPESTGRMNRQPDARADFYAAGAVLYEILTGTVPFPSSDPLEVIHAHLARTPLSPSMLDADVPQSISALVMKLLSKSPDDRYQSGAGLAHDLEICEHAWRATVAFPISGWAHATCRTRSASRQPCTDASGSAPSSCRPPNGLRTAAQSSCWCPATPVPARPRSYASSRSRSRGGAAISAPASSTRSYGTFPMARSRRPRALVSQLLAANEARLDALRERIHRSLGPNASVLAELVPDIALVLGPQPPSDPVDAAEARNRFRYVIQRLVSAITGEGHPLAIVLDDLQWSDAATLDALLSLIEIPPPAGPGRTLDQIQREHIISVLKSTRRGRRRPERRGHGAPPAPEHAPQPHEEAGGHAAVAQGDRAGEPPPPAFAEPAAQFRSAGAARDRAPSPAPAAPGAAGSSQYSS
jgi:serine/threonine protein kinase